MGAIFAQCNLNYSHGHFKAFKRFSIKAEWIKSLDFHNHLLDEIKNSQYLFLVPCFGLERFDEDGVTTSVEIW